MTETEKWKALRDAVKDDCPSALWSKGVALVRNDAVAGEEHSGDTWSFRVRSPGRPIPPTVALYSDDSEWDCDCGSRFDPCEHVAACVIAVSQSADGALALFADTAVNGRVRYELHREPEGLRLERFLVDESSPPRPLERSIADLLARRSPELTISPTHADIAVDRLLTTCRGGLIGFDKAASLLLALVGVTDLNLDDRPVRASGEPLFPCARVIDASGGAVELIIEPDPQVTEVVAPGILRSADTLHPFGGEARFGREWKRLPLHRTFAAAQMTELVATVIPELRRHITVEIVTDRLPSMHSGVDALSTLYPLSPWISFQIDFIDHGVDVLPLLVYGDPPVARIDGETLVHLQGEIPQRDQPREKRLLWSLRDRLNLIPGRRVHLAASEAARFLSDLESFADGRPRSPAEQLGVKAKRATLVPRLELHEGDFELIFEVDGESPTTDKPRASAEAVVGAWRDGIGLVPLSDGGFAHLPSDWLEKQGHLVGDLLAARDQNDGHTPKAALPLLGELCEALDSPEPFELTRLRPLVEQPALADGEDPTAALERAGCSDFRGELRAYQASGVAWLARLRDAELGAILADDMGLGKTVQALCVLRGRSLVVCPRSVIHNWSKEAARFRPELSVALYHGPRRELSDANLTLTTYATLRNDAERLCEVEWDAVILDEAQAIKNPSSQAARAAFRLNSRFRLSLSGTPIENRADELWSQMHFVNRGLLGGRRDFAERYEKPMIAGDPEASLSLSKRVGPFILRRLKREVASELPPRSEAVMYCELADEERAIYDAVRLASRKDVVSQLAGSGSVLAALEALLRLRQAACHSGLLPNREASTSSKVEALCEALEDAVADGHKALVFSQWTGLLDRVEPHLESREINFTRLDGKTRDRGAVVEAFQDADGPPVMLISLKAGGTGLNLTAADHVFLLDPWWNPAVEDQAADRAHRIGQDRPVMIYRLVAKDTVEERVLDLQQRKRELAASVLAGAESGAAATLTRDDIMALLD